VPLWRSQSNRQQQQHTTTTNFNQCQSTTAARRRDYGRCDCSSVMATITTSITSSVHGEGDGGGHSSKSSYTARPTYKNNNNTTNNNNDQPRMFGAEDRERHRCQGTSWERRGGSQPAALNQAHLCK
jgi:type II secretory pathway pseudopilin PulG